MVNCRLYNLQVPSKIIINVRLNNHNNICNRYKTLHLVKIRGWWNNRLRSKILIQDGARVLGLVRWFSRERKKVKINKTIVNWKWAPVLSWSTMQNLSPQLQLPLQKITVNQKYKTIDLLVERGEISKILTTLTKTPIVSVAFSHLSTEMTHRVQSWTSQLEPLAAHLNGPVNKLRPKLRKTYSKEANLSVWPIRRQEKKESTSSTRRNSCRSYQTITKIS